MSNLWNVHKNDFLNWCNIIWKGHFSWNIRFIVEVFLLHHLIFEDDISQRKQKQTGSYPHSFGILHSVAFEKELEASKFVWLHLKVLWVLNKLCGLLGKWWNSVDWHLLALRGIIINLLLPSPPSNPRLSVSFPLIQDFPCY